MQVAEKNIEEKFAEFTIEYQQERQTVITDELLEIVTDASYCQLPSKIKGAQ